MRINLDDLRVSNDLRDANEGDLKRSVIGWPKGSNWVENSYVFIGWFVE